MQDLVQTAKASQEKSIADKNKSLDQLNGKTSESSMGMVRNSNTNGSAKNSA